MVDKNGTKDEAITHVDLPGEVESADTGDEGGDAGNAEGAEKPTLSDLADAGLSKGEIEIAKAQGLVKGDSDGGDKGDGSDGASNKGTDKKDGEPDAKKEEKEKAERNRVLTKGKSPEQIIAEIGEKGALSQEQEQALMANLSQNGQAMYWAQKKERQKRQKTEGEFNEFKASTQKQIDDLKAELAATKTKKAEDDPLDLDGVDAAEEVDPENKPLTKADLDKIEADKKAKADEEKKNLDGRITEVRDALNYQQEEAKERYGSEEFESALGFTNEMLTKANAGQLEELYPEPRQRSRIIRKVVDLLKAFASADQFEAGDFNAADMTYELAKEHPKYKPVVKKTNANGNKNGETGADGNPEDVDRALKNANRRGSSATLNGGSSRRVALEELTADQAVKVPLKNWNKLPKEHRDRLLQS